MILKEITIKLPNVVYESILDNNEIYGDWENDLLGILCNAIAHGTPFPKNHGRLVDADKIANEISALKDNWNRYGNDYEGGRYDSYDYAVDVIEDAPTIIPAESEKEE